MLHNLSLWWFYAGLFASLFLLDRLVFSLAARRARALVAQEQTGQAIRLLKWVLWLPSWQGQAGKLDVRYVLGACLGRERRFADAAVQWQKILRFLYSYGWGNLHGLEADVRCRLADCLEMLGQPGEAAQQRERAQESLDGKKVTVWSLSAQSDLLEMQGKHAAAYAALEQGLALVKPNAKPQRVEFMARLVTAAHYTGRPDLAVQWAEQALENGASGVTAIGCRRAAGDGYSEMGDWENAERCRQKVQALAEAAGNVQETQFARLLAATLLQRQGQPSEAISLCRSMLPAAREAFYSMHIIAAECLRDLGRYDDAHKAVQEARNTSGFLTPLAERRAQALAALHMAGIASAAERPGEAMMFLREAASELGRDERMSLWVSATGAVLHAQLQERDLSEAQAQAVLRALPRFAQDRAALRTGYGNLASAAYSLGDWTRSQELWALYFAQEPYPNAQPMGWYYQGDCALALGDKDKARAKFQEAQTVNPELHYAQLARRRLDEMTA